jgi:hypothetical protein
MYSTVQYSTVLPWNEQNWIWGHIESKKSDKNESQKKNKELKWEGIIDKNEGMNYRGIVNEIWEWEWAVDREGWDE